MKRQNRAVAIALSATLCACALFAATPIGWWSMDSLSANGTVPDLSGNNRPLTLLGNACLTNDAVSGRRCAIQATRWVPVRNFNVLAGSKRVRSRCG